MVGTVDSVNDTWHAEGEQRQIVVSFDDDAWALEGADLDDLELADGITIHKSQGSEFPVGIIVLSNKHLWMFDRKLFYTAVTRPKDKLIIVGDFDACKGAVRHNRSNDRCCLLPREIG